MCDKKKVSNHERQERRDRIEKGYVREERSLNNYESLREHDNSSLMSLLKQVDSKKPKGK